MAVQPDMSAETAAMREQVQEQALAWLVRLNGDQVAAQDRADFEAWLAATPLHAQAFNDARRIWRALGEPAEIVGAGGWYRQPAATVPASSGLSRWYAAMLPRPALAGLCALAAAVVILVWQSADRGTAGGDGRIYVTASGAPESLTLADGSIMHMDGQGRATVRFADGLRIVDLQQGRAWFDVTRSSAPFIVKAGPVETRVLGTAFTVERTESDVAVTVERGRVQVSRAGEPGAITLSVGQQARVDEHLPAAASAVDVGTAFAWRRGLLVFDRARLDAVAGEIDRLGRERVVLLGRDLKAETMSGTFQRQDRTAILEALRSGLGLSMVEIPGIAVFIYR